MVAYARRELLGGERQAVFHCWTRCVRRAFLCGRDSHTRKDYSHRRDWIVRREEQLAGLFAITIEFRAELSSHLHNVLRTLPRVARRWSAQEVARRANAEDDCTGRFWENRFQCRECTDESAILLCGLYVEQGFGHAVG